MQIVVRCKGKSKAHNKENQRNNNQYSSVNFTNKANSLSCVFKELPTSNENMYSSVHSSNLSGISAKDEDLLIKSLEMLEVTHKTKTNNEAYLSTYG